MKRVLIAILAFAMVLTIVGCGAKPVNEGPSGGDNGAASDDGGANAGKSDKIGFEKEGEYIVFKVNPAVKLDENAWLGITPAGVEYKTEAEADEEDIIWTSIDNPDKAPSESWVFKFYSEDIEAIEDGDYSMVLCDNDDEGNMVLLFPIVISGSDIAPDLTKIKIY